MAQKMNIFWLATFTNVTKKRYNCNKKLYTYERKLKFHAFSLYMRTFLMNTSCLNFSHKPIFIFTQEIQYKLDLLLIIFSFTVYGILLVCVGMSMRWQKKKNVKMFFVRKRSRLQYKHSGYSGWIWTLRKEKKIVGKCFLRNTFLIRCYETWTFNLRLQIYSFIHYMCNSFGLHLQM